MCLVNCDCVCWCDRMYNANMPFHLLSSFDSTCRVYHQLSLCNACELFMYAIRKPIINYCFNKLRFDWVRAAISYGDRWAIKLYRTTCVRIRHEPREREEKREREKNRIRPFKRWLHRTPIVISRYEKLVRFCFDWLFKTLPHELLLLASIFPPFERM